MTISGKQCVADPQGTSDDKQCRNADSKAGGPWCFVDIQKHIWEYCDVPFCKRMLFWINLTKLAYLIELSTDVKHIDSAVCIRQPQLLKSLCRKACISAFVIKIVGFR